MNPSKFSPSTWAAIAAAALILAFGLAAPQQPKPATVQNRSVPEVERSHLDLREGRLHLGTQPFTGFVIERFADSALRSRSAVANGLLHGVSEGWHTNRVKEIQEHFVNGVSHGRRLRWDESGNKLSEAEIVNGKIEGVFRRWHTNGALAEELTMNHGEPEGLSRAWYPSGCLKAEATVSQGIVSGRKTYEDGERPGSPTAPGRHASRSVAK